MVLEDILGLVRIYCATISTEVIMLAGRRHSVLLSFVHDVLFVSPCKPDWTLFEANETDNRERVVFFFHPPRSFCSYVIRCNFYCPGNSVTPRLIQIHPRRGGIPETLLYA